MAGKTSDERIKLGVEWETMSISRPIQIERAAL